MKPYKIKIGMKARYKLTVRDKSEKILRESGWSDNVLTDHLFAMMGGNTEIRFRGMVVGTGNAPADVTDTHLDNYLAAASTRFSSIVENQSTVSPRYIRRIVVDRFDAVGGGPVNISEVGMIVQENATPAPSGSSMLGSRSLVVDGGGSPTVVPWNRDDEILDVTWEWDTYVPEDVVVSSIPFDNDGSAETRETTCRAAVMNTSGQQPGGRVIAGMTANSPAFSSIMSNPASSRWGGFFETQDLFDYSTSNLVSYDYASDIEWVGYNPGTLTISFKTHGDLTVGNYGNGIGLYLTPEVGGGRWQFSFDTPIPKDGDHLLEIEWDLVFERL